MMLRHTGASVIADEPEYRTHIDGRDAAVEDLSALAFAGFAHFTAMQVRDGAVRGLDLHLTRLRSASIELFGQALPDDQVRRRLRNAVEGGPPDVSLTVTMFSRAGEFTRAGAHDDPAVLVRTGPASDGPDGPLRLAEIAHERPLPAIKHVGEITKTHYLRLAVEQGYDDAAFVNAQGNLSEATIWNLAFWDGDTVVWPKAAFLRGITMGILQRQLAKLDIPQREQAISRYGVREMKGAVVMNSWTPGVPVIGIGSTTLPASPRFLNLLRMAYAREPLTQI